MQVWGIKHDNAFTTQKNQNPLTKLPLSLHALSPLWHQGPKTKDQRKEE
jgi:hypothetical protein